MTIKRYDNEMNDRDCHNCAHHSEGGCSVWECSFEQKDDTISRLAAIGAPCGECQANCIPCESFPCGEIKAVQALPSAQPEQRWIPVTERLPEEDKPVFVYLFYDSPHIVWLSEGVWYTDDFIIDKDDEPTAWMPLPEPYREEGEQ